MELIDDRVPPVVIDRGSRSGSVDGVLIRMTPHFLRVISISVILLLAVGYSSAQNPNTSPFPGALDTDATLLVANDAVSTILNGALTATATTIPVATASSISAFPLSCWVDIEVIKISGKVVDSLTVATDCPAGTCPTCAPTTTCRGWGFPDTTEASHLTAADFICGPTAEIENAAAAAIKAIQAALGVNLSNAGHITCDSPVTLTISAGLVVVPASGCYLIETESMAATDDLDTVTCAVAVHFIFMAANDARTVIVKDNGSNMDLPGNFALDGAKDQFLGRCDSTNVVAERGRIHAP